MSSMTMRTSRRATRRGRSRPLQTEENMFAMVSAVWRRRASIQRLNASSNHAIDLIFAWDPTEPVATRPLVWNRDTSVAYYTHDGNKNVQGI